MFVSFAVSSIFGVFFFYKKKLCTSVTSGRGGWRRARDGGSARKRKRRGFDVLIGKLLYVTAPRETAPSDRQRGRKRS